MIKSNNIVFLVSSGGGTLRFIKKCIDCGILDGKIIAVIGDRECDAVNFARKHNLKNFVVNYSRENNFELKNVLEKLNIDFIVTNIHKIIDEELVDKYRGKLINLHYSLLPAFIGFNSVKKAIEKGCKFLGTTVHYVDELMDNGQIISQNIIALSEEKLEFSVVMDKVFRAGCLNLLNSLLLIQNINFKVNIREYNDIIFSPSIVFDTAIFDEVFWKEIRNESNI